MENCSSKRRMKLGKEWYSTNYGYNNFYKRKKKKNKERQMFLCCRAPCNRYRSRVILQDMLHEIPYYDARIWKSCLHDQTFRIFLSVSSYVSNAFANKDIE